jgi:hypothetical protein
VRPHYLRGIALTIKSLTGASPNVSWRNIAISPIDSGFGEQKAQSGENACLRQLTTLLHEGIQCCGFNGGHRMAYVPDLAETGSLKSVGYLSRNHDYPKGETSDEMFARLICLAKHPLGAWAGEHLCDLGYCGSNRPQPEFEWQGMEIPRCCSTDILVPDKTVVYIAPALILHYIRAHHYLPPACFIEAVLVCPEPDSADYRSEIKRIVPSFGVD